jgi:hypothetical protein
MPIPIFDEYKTKIKASLARQKNDDMIRSVAHQVAEATIQSSGQKPVIFFNASTRLSGLSLNAAFSLISAWTLRLAGVPVIHFVCNKGMSRCVLGTNRDAVQQNLPCEKCLRQSKAEYERTNTAWFEYQPDDSLNGMLDGLSIDMLMKLTYQDIPVGELVLPALRWELRRHRLTDDEPTRFLYRQFILSAWNVGREFQNLLLQVNPQAVVVFNGQFFPEAMVRFIAQKVGIRVITHEVGMMPFSAFFTEGEATAYPMDIPPSFNLTTDMDEQLDAYLTRRFKGNFKMAGIQFWQSMDQLDERFLQKASRFKHIVPIFTNVIFDTSQPHSNVLFEDMFIWLDQVLEVIKQHPETLFVIRAHPDELRPGSTKQSRETVRDWVQKNGVTELPNVHFVDATEYLSSYELIQRSKFVMVYNSSIGLEASILGSTVLAAGRSRYTRYPTVLFPDTISDYMSSLFDLLEKDTLPPTPDQQKEARRVLYYQLYRTAIPFANYLEESHRPGLVLLKSFGVDELRIENSPALQVVANGILHGNPFTMDEL